MQEPECAGPENDCPCKESRCYTLGTSMTSRIALILLLISCAAAGQQQPPPEGLLQRLQGYSTAYRERLPSLSCDELIVSQSLKHGKVKKTVKIEATLREVRDGGGPDPFSEKVEFKTVNGHAVTGFFKMPYYVQGGFANLIGFTQPELGGCFDYAVSPIGGSANQRLTITPKAHTALGRCATIPQGYRRIVVFDPASDRILHTERIYPAEPNQEVSEPYFAAIDYAPQKLGDAVFWLPSVFTAHDEKDERRMTARYSNYHRYAGEMKVLPAGSAP